MEQEILEKYEVCPRFDEGAYCHTKEYAEVAAQREKLRDLLVKTFGEQIMPLLEEYTAVLYHEMELEARHFFAQGYLMR